jgi:hypothetical protein
MRKVNSYKLLPVLITGVSCTNEGTKKRISMCKPAMANLTKIRIYFEDLTNTTVTLLQTTEFPAV